MSLQPKFKKPAELEPPKPKEEGYILIYSSGRDIALMPNTIRSASQLGDGACRIYLGDHFFHVYGELSAVLRAITAAKSGAQIDLRAFCKDKNKSLTLEDNFDDTGHFTQRHVKVDKLEKIAKSGYRWGKR